jgi:hypothetical protein
VRVWQTAWFEGEVSGTPPPACQWRFNGRPLEGQTGAKLTLSNVIAAQTGVYDMLATNAGGSTNSEPVSLSVETNALALVPVPGAGGGQVQFKVYSLEGRQYFLQYKDDLSEPGWTDLPVVPGGGIVILSDTPGNSPERFYRVREE